MDIGLDLQTAYREGYEQGKLDAFADLTGGRKDNYVPVVRCKDCVKRHTEECAMWYEDIGDDYQYSWESDDDYCSWGGNGGIVNESNKI